MKTRSQRDDERKERRNKLIVSLILVFLMVFSTIGYFFAGNTSNTIKYNGHKITPVTNDQGLVQGYSTKIDGQQRYFLTTPQDTLSIPLPPGFIEDLRSSKAIVFLFNPQDNKTQLYDQLRFDFSDSIQKQQGAAITQPSSLYKLQVANCNDTQQGYPFVLLRTGERNVTQEDGCYVLQGNEPYDFALLRDRILYAYYGVTEE